MMSSHRKTAVRWLAVLVGLVFALCDPAIKLRAEKRIELKQVFEFKPKPWRDWPLAVLTPQGDRIHFLSGPILQVIDRANRRVVAKTDYSHLECPDPKEFYAWLILPSEREILANYCTSLLVIDGRSFKVAKSIFQQSAREGVAGVELSPDGFRAAVVIQGPSEAGTYRRIVFFDTRTWTEEKSWSVNASGLAFSQDGRLLVYEKTRLLSDTEARCGIEVREVDSGKTYSEWWPTRKWRSSPTGVSFIVDDPGCPSQPVFLPGRKNLIAAALGESVVIWDVEKRQVVKELRGDRRIGEFLISPDGNLLIADVATDPDMPPPYKQDFTAWDIHSGSIVYESPKRKWTLIEGFLEPWLRTDLVLNGFSSDGRYLLVTRHKRITLYEVVPASNARN